MQGKKKREGKSIFSSLKEENPRGGGMGAYLLAILHL